MAKIVLIDSEQLVLSSKGDRQPNAICAQCGESYWTRLSKLAGTKYCSRSCKRQPIDEKAALPKESNAVCNVCGKHYWIKPSLLEQSKFCSRACQDAGRKGGSVNKDELAWLYYDQQLSMQQIAERLRFSQHKIAYWMEQYGFERRNWSEATYLHRNPDGDPFKITMPTSVEEWQLFGGGLGLYMGEGTKTGQRVALANINPDIHRLFLAFLEQICGLRRKQVHAWINVYDDRDVDVATRWWCEQLGLSSEQLYAPVVRASRGGNYANKSKFGTLTTIFCNSKLKQIIDGWCIEFYSRYPS